MPEKEITGRENEVLPIISYSQRILGDMYSLDAKDQVPLPLEVSFFLEYDLNQGLQELSQRERDIINLRFSKLQDGIGDVMPHEQIGKAQSPSVSGGRIRQILERGYRKVRSKNTDYFPRYAFLALAHTSQKKMDYRRVFGEGLSLLSQMLPITGDDIQNYLEENNFYKGQVFMGGPIIHFSPEVMQELKMQIEKKLLEIKRKGK